MLYEVITLSANPISNTAAYIGEIKAKSSKRALATLATEIKKTTIEDDLPAEEVMNLVERKLYEITQNTSNQDFRESKEITLAIVITSYSIHYTKLYEKMILRILSTGTFKKRALR